MPTDVNDGEAEQVDEPPTGTKETEAGAPIASVNTPLQMVAGMDDSAADQGSIELLFRLICLKEAAEQRATHACAVMLAEWDRVMRAIIDARHQEALLRHELSRLEQMKRFGPVSETDLQAVQAQLAPVMDHARDQIHREIFVHREYMGDLSRLREVQRCGRWLEAVLGRRREALVAEYAEAGTTFQDLWAQFAKTSD